MGKLTRSADNQGVRTPEISTPETTPSWLSDAKLRSTPPESLAASLPSLVDAPVGWHSDDQVEAPWHRNELAEFAGDAWVPPITAPGLIAAPATAVPEPAKSTQRPRTVALAAGLAVVALLTVAIPRLMGTDSAPTGSTGVTTPLLDVASAVSAPETNAEGTTALAVAAGRRSRAKTFGTETNFGRTRAAAPSTLDYVLSVSPDSVRVVAPEMLNGVTHSHLTAETDALVLSERWPKTEAVQAELAKSIDGKFPLDLWLDPAGNLAKLIVHTINDGSGSEKEVVYE